MTFPDIIMPYSLQAKLRALASAHEVLTTGQLLEAGISDQSITRLVGEGILTQLLRRPVPTKHRLSRNWVVAK
jgi:hypothetical protein